MWSSLRNRSTAITFVRSDGDHEGRPQCLDAEAGERIVEPDVKAQDAYQFKIILDALYESARTGGKAVISRDL